MSDHPTFVAYVVESGGPHNRYHWDATARVLVLDDVARPAQARGVDLVRLPLTPLAPVASSLPRNHRRPSWLDEAGDDVPDVEATLARLGPSLLALALADMPIPVGARLEARFLGALHVSAAPVDASVVETPSAEIARWLAVALPAGDLALAQIESPAEVPSALRQRLLHALAMLFPALGDDPFATDRWIDAAAIASLYQAACADVRLGRRAAQDEQAHTLRERVFASPKDEERPLPWRELTPLSEIELLTAGEAAYAAPDRLLQWIPARFQRYLGELLLPDERALFFAECPPLHVRGWPGRVPALPPGAPEGAQVGGSRSGQLARWARGALGAFDRLASRTLYAGLLLITERQALLLRDYAPPDAAMTQWGYVAQSWPLGRVLAASALPVGLALDDDAALADWPREARQRLAGTTPYAEATVPDQWARLLIALDALDGAEIVGAAFPPNGADALRRAATLLAGFAPWPGMTGVADRRLRSAQTADPWKPTDEEVAALESLGELISPARIAALIDVTTEALGPGETILAQARTPAQYGHQSDAAALVTLTPQRLLIASVAQEGSAREAAQIRAIPLGRSLRRRFSTRYWGAR